MGAFAFAPSIHQGGLCICCSSDGIICTFGKRILHISTLSSEVITFWCVCELYCEHCVQSVLQLFLCTVHCFGWFTSVFKLISLRYLYSLLFHLSTGRPFIHTHVLSVLLLLTFILIFSRAYLYLPRLSSICSLLSLQITKSSANIVVHGNFCRISFVNLLITRTQS